MLRPFIGVVEVLSEKYISKRVKAWIFMEYCLAKKIFKDLLSFPPNQNTQNPQQYSVSGALTNSNFGLKGFS